MSELIVVGFDNEYRADEVMLTLSKLQKEEWIDLEDSAVVICDRQREISIKHKNHITGIGTLLGSFWGLLVGSLLMNPLVGLGVGAATGAATGKMIQVDLREDFIRELGKLMKPGTSAIFLLAKTVEPRTVIDAFQQHGGRAIHVELPKGEEKKLLDAVERQAAAALR